MFVWPARTRFHFGHPKVYSPIREIPVILRVEKAKKKGKTVAVSD
jgi:hypothetical protein